MSRSIVILTQLRIIIEQDISETIGREAKDAGQNYSERVADILRQHVAINPQNPKKSFRAARALVLRNIKKFNVNLRSGLLYYNLALGTEKQYQMISRRKYGCFITLIVLGTNTSLGFLFVRDAIANVLGWTPSQVSAVEAGFEQHPSYQSRSDFSEPDRLYFDFGTRLRKLRVQPKGRKTK